MIRRLLTRHRIRPTWVSVDRRGVITIAERRPRRGTITLFRFRDTLAAAVGRAAIATAARHAWDGKTLLVTGVPEAETDERACDALLAWARWIEPQLLARIPASRFTAYFALADRAEAA